MDRLLASETFLHAPRVQAVLRFLLESLQNGEIHRINEQAIGQDVFGRPTGYNAAEDNIVRVTVRHLRARLDRFYKTEGRDEEWVVQIPIGNYIPVIRARETRARETETDPAVELPKLPGLGSAATSQSYARWVWAFLALLLASNLLTYYFARAPQSILSSASARSGLVPALFSDPNHHLSVVLTDSDLAAYRMVVNRVVPLSAYVDRSYLSPSSAETAAFPPGAWKYMSRGQDTTLSSVLIADRLQSSIFPRLLDVRHPHSLSIRDFNRDDFILLGGPWINPWGQLFESRLNFRVIPLETDAAGSRILNLQPAPGESKFFAGHANGAFSVGYARLALLPNLTNTGKVILVGATDEQALEAGGNFLLQPDDLAKLLTKFSARSALDLPFLEIVLEVTGVDSNPVSVRIVAERVVQDSSFPRASQPGR
jgi:hypothetical protein